MRESGRAVFTLLALVVVAVCLLYAGINQPGVVVFLCFGAACLAVGVVAGRVLGQITAGAGTGSRLEFSPAAPKSAPVNRDAVVEDSTSFLSSVGHDLRQPLQAISLYAATLATHSLPENSRELVAGLETASETLSLQFEEVMAIAKVDAGRVELEPRSVVLDSIFAEVVSMHTGAAHEKAVHLRYVGTRLRVWADETQLARALERIVAHVVQVTESGGVLLGCRRRGDQVLIEVRDTSRGVPEELKGEVFKPFSRYGQRMPDRALGLVLAQRIVMRLGGKLEHRCASGAGNTFTLTLPKLTGSAML